jgi:Zn-finger nucleic acid-binding protein
VSPDALACPRCGTALTSFREPQGLTFACAECAGHAEGVSVLRKRLEADAVNDLWQRALTVRARNGLPCPSCRWAMAEVAFQAEDREAVVDACDRCLLVWFDAKERDALPARPPPPEPERLSAAAAEALVRVETHQAREATVQEVDVDAGTVAAEALALPRAVDGMDAERRPWATWTVATLLFAVFVAQLVGGDVRTFGRHYAAMRFVDEWGFVPAAWARKGGLTWLSSFPAARRTTERRGRSPRGRPGRP